MSSLHRGNWLFCVLNSSEIFVNHLRRVPPHFKISYVLETKAFIKIRFRKLFYCIRFASDAQINRIYHTPWPSILNTNCNCFCNCVSNYRYFCFYDKVDVIASFQIWITSVIRYEKHQETIFLFQNDMLDSLH